MAGKPNQTKLKQKQDKLRNELTSFRDWGCQGWKNELLLDPKR
jgi:hypothetical protein